MGCGVRGGERRSRAVKRVRFDDIFGGFLKAGPQIEAPIERLMHRSSVFKEYGVHRKNHDCYWSTEMRCCYCGHY
jgi:hypothetical protein